MVVRPTAFLLALGCVTAFGAFLLHRTTQEPPASGPLEQDPTALQPSKPAMGVDEPPRRTSAPEASVPISSDSDEPTTFAALVDAHLKTAPKRLQRKASDLFLQQAEHYARQAAASQGADFASVLQELEDRFAERLRRAAAQAIALNKGVLLVDGFPEERALLDDKQYLIWGGSEQLLDRSVRVLVILDPPDTELLALEKAHRDVRGAMLAEMLVGFNAKPPEERRRVILEFKQLREANAVKGNWFGVDEHHLRHVMVDERTWAVLPMDQ